MVKRKRIPPEKLAEEPEGPPMTASINPPEEKGQKRRVGRPSSYRDEYAPLAKTLCENGARDVDLADEFGTTTTAIHRWKSQFPEFRDALRRGKDQFDDDVERTLAQRALGYHVDLTEYKVLADGAVLEYKVRRYIPPDTTAAIFWLKNRRPKEWRDRREISGPNEGPIPILTLDEKVLARMTPEQLQVLDAALGVLKGRSAPEAEDDDDADAGMFAKLIEHDPNE